MLLNYKIPSYQSIPDAMVAISVPLDDIVSVLKLSDLNFNDTAGTIIYDTAQIVTIVGGQPVDKPIDGKNKYITNGTQNIYDVTLMTVGDLNKLIMFLKQNDYYFPNTNSAVDGVFLVNYNDVDVTDSGFKLIVKKSKINFTTGDKDAGHSFDYSYNYSFDS